ncbi:hypothetical protein EJ03DRAFT_329569 [Teratosphaeria nubilosa]|uniref:CBM1 domain-containing protein n=1 Tax=Teratosphaeria nubilosa TaxID=161662 RepID=A0A6G1L385_9PEZI|nr:hypothetical protein EJ03DRAFT_329569 [Teratosphaeria nubilosa]
MKLPMPTTLLTTILTAIFLLLLPPTILAHWNCCKPPKCSTPGINAEPASYCVSNGESLRTMPTAVPCAPSKPCLVDWNGCAPPTKEAPGKANCTW